MDVILNNSSGEPFYEQIVRQVKRLIQAGELQEGEALPSMRQLAKDLRVSVITTTRAYGDLEAEGLIYTLQGRGSFVKGDAEAVRRQYLQAIDKSLTAAVEKGLAAGLNLSGLQKRLEEIYHEQCH